MRAVSINSLPDFVLLYDQLVAYEQRHGLIEVKDLARTRDLKTLVSRGYIVLGEDYCMTDTIPHGVTWQ